VKNTIQWIIAGLLIAVIALQIIVIKKMPGEAEVPSLKEIDQRVMHWTMHHGQHFSSKGEVSSLRSAMDARLERIERKLDMQTEEEN
jgi:hypothetical protein